MAMLLHVYRYITRANGLFSLFIAALLLAEVGVVPLRSYAELPTIPAPPTTLTALPVPQAVYKEMEFNFGTVLQGTPVIHTFTFVNSGSAPLIITSVRPACGCTSATPANTQVLPGAVGEVKVTFDTTGFDGAKEKTVTVSTNDPNKSTVVFTLKGYVEGTLIFKPTRIQFDSVIAGQGSTFQTATVTVKNLSDLKITGFRASSPNLVLENGKMNDRFGTFDVAISPQAPTGAITERISVETVRDNGEKNSFVLPVTAVVNSTVLVEPRVVSFGVMSGVNDTLTRAIKITATSDDTPLSILGVSTSDSFITTNLQTISPQKEYILTVRIDPKQVKKDLRGKVFISTSDPANASIGIDVFAITPGEE